MAQENTTASGGEGSGTGGTASYTVGQVVYTTNVGTGGSVAQGVQQPFEISVTTGLNETTVNLEMSVYPNPTINYLTLKVEEIDLLTYQLFDTQGKVIETKKVVAKMTSVQLEALPKAVYFLKVTDGNKTVKTFKIIKN